MGEVERNSLKFWVTKIINDPELLPVFKDVKGVRTAVTTYCNIGVHRICRGMDYDYFDGMLANEIYDYCSARWIKPYGSTVDQMLAAYNAALVGDLAILALKDKPHGHVAVVAPERPMLYSGKWGIYIPQVANIGKTNGIMGANYAFKEVPDVFILGKTIV